MGFLKNFVRNVFHEDGLVETTSSFDQLSTDELEAHLSVSQYGKFVLTDAVRPSFDLDVVPSAGFRHDVYRDESSKQDVPVLMAAASREHAAGVAREIFAFPGAGGPELRDPADGRVARVVLWTRPWARLGSATAGSPANTAAGTARATE